MKRQILCAVALGFIQVTGSWSLAATNPTPNKGSAPAPQTARPAPATQPNSNNTKKSNNNSSAANKNSPSNKNASSNRIPGYYNNATGSYYPDGYGPNNPKPSPTVQTTSGNVYTRYRHDHRYNDYYGNYYPSYAYYSGYSNGYGYPYGTTPYGLGYSSYGQPYLYPVYPSYGYGYGYSYGPAMYGAYYGNPFADSSQLFGPGPILHMLGVDQWANPGNANVRGVDNGNGNIGGGNAGIGSGGVGNAQAKAANNAPNNPAQNNPAPNVAAANDPANRPPPGRAATVAWKFITYGDGYFGKKQYIDASERYRTASRQTATVADAWFRQGFAQAALGKYDQAAKSFRHGLEINPDWATSDFHLSDLYGADDEEKKNKIDAMVAAVGSQPNDPDVSFVLGVHLYFDGQPDKAAPYFRKAAQVSGSDADVKGFATAKQ